MFFEELGQRCLDRLLLARVTVHLLDAERQVRPIEPRDDPFGRVHRELADDVVLNFARRRRGERECRHVAEELSDFLEASEIGAKIVAPLRDAVRFVDGEQRDVDRGDRALEGAIAESFGCDVDELVVSRAQPVETAPLLLVRDRAVDEGDGDAAQSERVDLILHQRDERGHDHRRPGKDQSGDLVTERLAAARRHDDEAVLPVGDRPERSRLTVTKVVEAEGVSKDRSGRREELVSRRRSNHGRGQGLLVSDSHGLPFVRG